MRTTVTLADDVAAALERRRRELGVGLSEALNDIARAGLVAQNSKARKPIELPSFDMGRTLIDYTNVAEAISAAEGVDHR